jgi:hypothetical protein
MRVILFLAFFMLGGCASSKVVMKNCEPVGDSKYSLCNKLGLFE